jgi:hemoglobin-like flavoprotein
MKKQSATKQILNILNTKGGRKPKDLIKEIKLPASNIYTGLAYLRSKKKIAKKDDGVYISQTQKEVSKVTNKLIRSPYITSLETQVHELEKLHDGWRQNYKKLEADYTQAKIMYLDSQAVVKYLEEKVAKLIKG